MYGFPLVHSPFVSSSVLSLKPAPTAQTLLKKTLISLRTNSLNFLKSCKILKVP